MEIGGGLYLERGFPVEEASQGEWGDVPGGCGALLILT